jgi:transposase
MNNRQKKKIFKQKLYTLSKQNDYVILEYDIHKITSYYINEYGNFLTKTLNINNLICIPNSLTLKDISKENLNKIIENMQGFLKQNDKC